MKTAVIRRKFLEYFQQRGHTIVPSSLLIPDNDPSLLFTNAGMVQFKDVFLGKETREYNRAVSSQRCVRAGGKHNDLENVGFTAKHHTFFEMLGNFSFGDYFKREAINYAWNFVTKELRLPVERLWVTVYREDQESADIWLKEIGIPESQFTRCGEKSNFWMMGDTGPCGPCTEIYYDHGAEVAGGPPGTPEEDGDRYSEIWNLVFMQYNRDETGKLTPLLKPSVDTGMGLERIAAVMQGVHSNYEIDIFAKLIAAIAKLTHTKDLKHKSLRVIADHLRSCAFLVADGVLPSNEGRGYVLRRIMRRAIRHAHSLGVREIFFHKLVPNLVKEMGDGFPELAARQQYIMQVFEQEEIQFCKTLDQGLKIISSMIESNQAVNSSKILPGDMVFKLYDTFGFPVDLTSDIARDHGMTLDLAGFDRAMAEQKQRARDAQKFSAKVGDQKSAHVTSFLGYEQTTAKSKIVEIFKAGEAVESLREGETGLIVLAETPFYAEAGGQVGDTGEIFTDQAKFSVADTQYLGKANGHSGKMVSGTLRVGQPVTAAVDVDRRAAIRLNHSATHLLHAALRTILGKHVEQRGSVVAPDKLRFDFAHFAPLTQEQLIAIEKLVNEKIRANSAANTKVMPLDEAKHSGAIALFGEKYADKVRVLNMADGFSIELCGGTHVARTGDIGLFKITSEAGIAAGVRRLEAVTGEAALELIQRDEQCLTKLAELLKAPQGALEERVQQLQGRIKTLERSLAQVQSELVHGSGTDLTQQAREIKGIKVLAALMSMGDAKSLREALDKLKPKLGNAVIVLGVANDGKVTLVAGVSKDCTDKIKANDLVNYVAQQVGGRGGGRADLAQAGGEQPDKLNSALNSVFAWVEERL